MHVVNHAFKRIRSHARATRQHSAQGRKNAAAVAAERRVCGDATHPKRLHPNELGLEPRLAVLEEHGHGLLDVLAQLVDTLPLAVRSGRTGNVANVVAGIKVPLDDEVETSQVITPARSIRHAPSQYSLVPSKDRVSGGLRRLRRPRGGWAA